MQNQIEKSKRGFTLLELLVVMVIIGLLAGYVGPKYFAQVGKVGGENSKGTDGRSISNDDLAV